MATLINVGSGNFTTAASWGVVNTTSLIDAIDANTALTTSYVGSSTFTPGAITIDGFAVKIASVSASPTGTMSCEIYNPTGAASVAGTEVTINVSDIATGDSAANGGCGWYFLKFAAPVTLLAATAYTVRAKTSSSTQVNLFRNASANNWSRLLRTTTTAAPAASDNLFVMGEWTAAATFTACTLTVDNTATTAFGSLTVSNKGTFIFGTSASTNYYFKTTNINVYSGGTFDSGTSLPSTSSITVYYNSTGGAQYGLTCYSGGIFSGAAPSKTIRTNMTANKVATNTVIALADTTGWKVSDELVFPSTTRTSSQTETKTVLTVDSSTQVTLTAGLTNDHLGSGDTVCEVANVTRNVLHRGASGANSGFILLKTGSVVNLEYVQFRYMGTGSVDGIIIQTTTGTCTMDGCVFMDGTNSSTGGVSVTATTGSGINISNTIIYNFTDFGLNIAASSTATNTYDTVYILGCGANGFFSGNAQSTYLNIKAAGNATGVYFSQSGGGNFASCDGIEVHSNSSYGLRLVSANTGLIENVVTWRNNGEGIFINTMLNPELTIDTITAFGNGTANILCNNSAVGCGYVIFKSATLNGGSTLVTATGIQIADNVSAYYFENCSLGVTTQHSSNDINCSTACGPSVYLYNTTFNSATEVLNQTNIFKNYQTAGIISVNHDGVAGAQKSWSRYGTISTDTSIYNTASPSIRLAPLSASLKLPSAYRIIPVASGATVTVTVYVRKSDTVSGDAATYNGNQPRLMLRKNLETGILSDTVLDTMTAAVGNWEALTATTATASADGAFEFYVDCDGTTGWVNVDDFTTTSNTDPSGMKYWYYGEPAINGGDPEDGAGGSSGGSWTF